MSNYAPARNIRSVASYMRGLWDWTFLNVCFAGTRIKVADVDGIVERRGHFLWLEAKPEKRNGIHEVTDGQRYTHEALMRTGAFTVITVWGDSSNDLSSEYLARTDATAMICALGEPEPTYVRVWYENGEKWEDWTDKKHFVQIVSEWFQWSQTAPRR